MTDALQEPEAEFKNYGLYFDIASEHYASAKEANCEPDAGKEKKVSIEDYPPFGTDEHADIEYNTVAVIIFCALSLEAYINDYAISRISKNYLEKYLDKLDLVSKWIVIPRIVTGKQLDPGAQPIQDLSWLVGMRNRLVHYKSRKIPFEELQDSHFLRLDDADKAMYTVTNLVLALKKIDNEAYVDWVK